MRTSSLIVVFTLFLLIGVSSVASSPLEQTISQRQSIKNAVNAPISTQQLLNVLRSTYGYSGSTRIVPKIGSDYSLVILPVNASGSYRYIPETNSLVVHDSSVNLATIKHHLYWGGDPNVVVVVVWDQTKMNNPYFASAEAGCFVQNMYLEAVSLDLGTYCQGTIIDFQGLRNDLKLPATMIPLLTMPLGSPTSPYPAASPNYGYMTGNLPLVQYSSLSFTDALNNMLYAQAWSGQNLSLQELSQLLWAAYGYTNITYSGSYHRTTPSSYNIYPLVVYVSNATATYRYVPGSHSVQVVQAGDKRLDIANACGNQVWAANAPAIFLVAYDSSYNGGNTGDGGSIDHEYIEVDAGCVVQQLLLEASAWNLSANVVSNGLDTWNGTGAGQIRNILGLPPSLIPLYITPIGHKTSASPVDGVSIPVDKLGLLAPYVALASIIISAVVITTVFFKRKKKQINHPALLFLIKTSKFWRSKVYFHLTTSTLA